MLALALLTAWLTPVDGTVAERFVGGSDPFARGLRRAVVFRAGAGETVRAPCSGRVTFAGTTPRGEAVTLRCGGRRVTLMPLRGHVREGDVVARGAGLGRASGRLGLSVREGAAYVDPELLLASAPDRAPPVAPPRRSVRRPLTPRRAWPRPVRVPAVRAAPAGEPTPWPAWLGAGLLAVAGLAGVRVRVRRRPGSASRLGGARAGGSG